MPERIIVADELGGVRADAGLAKLMGISRSLAATLIAEGNVLSGGKPMGKSAKLAAGDVLYVTVPERRDPLEVVEEVVEGLKILLDDDEFVVVDKPVGVAGLGGPHSSGRPGGRRVPDLDIRLPGTRRHRAQARRRHVRCHGGGQDRARLHGPEEGLQGAEC